MKKILLLFFPLIIFGQTNKSTCETLFKINEIIQEKHYKPKALNDSLSKYVFTAFLSELDENNKLFLVNEIENLKKHQYKIDDYIETKDCQFLKDFYKVYSTAIVRNNKIYNELEKELISFESTETILFSREPFPYVSNEIELQKRIKKTTIFQILKNIAETSKNKDSLIQNFSKLSIQSKKKVFELYKCKTAELNYSELEFNSKFLNVFCSYFDPHTSYFSKEDKTNFLTSVSSNNLSFGLMLVLNENDDVIIQNIIPGSSAYFSEKIEEGDQLLKIETQYENIEVSCTSRDKVENVFSSNEIKKSDFIIRKKSGEVYKVSLDKKELTNYSTSLYCFILKKENKKFGYIKIPSFYGEIGSGETNVSDDLAKEIYKLNKENIDGLIVDVQNNGGGSMIEALKVTGMFIDIGPVAIMNDQQNKNETLRDPNRGSIYSGPFVVLVNTYSASASEFFANAIQDYQRGIIVGSRTRGKATMQTILPVNDAFIKLTIEGFYRITGKSNQGIGILPDVEIPYLFENQIEHEDEIQNAIKNDEIIPKMKFTLFNNPKKEVAVSNSKIRIKSNEDASKVASMNDKINTLFDFNFEPIPLNFSAVFDEVGKINSIWNEIKTLTEIQFPIEVEQSKEEIEYQQFDEFIKNSNLEKIKAIKSNLHIFEAINIINDLTP